MAQRAQSRADGTDERIPKWHDSRNRFCRGNPGGVGGPRPGGGRPPKPKNPTLLRQLYALLDEASPKALARLVELIEHEDVQVSLRACEMILRKTLPDQSRLQTTLEAQGVEEVVLSPQIVTLFGRLNAGFRSGPDCGANVDDDVAPKVPNDGHDPVTHNIK